MTEFEFSVIIPTHNSALGIEKTINSLINQTLDFKKNIEIIVIDSNSIDNTEEICSEYAEKFPKNIKFIQNDSQIAKNAGIRNASGRYINFLESNDYISQNTLNSILNFIKNNPEADLIATPMYYYKNGRKEKYLNCPIKNTELVNLLKEPSKSQFLGPSTFIKKESIKDCEFSNSFNENITFLNEILIDNPILGICSDGSYFIENIEEKVLPTEDVEIDGENYDKFVEENLTSLIAKNKNKFSRIPKFTQYSILNHMHWILSIEKSKEEIDLSPLKETAKIIDDEIILNNELIENDEKILLFILKYGGINEELKEKLCLDTVSIDTYDIIQGKLVVLASLTNVSKRDVEIFINGQKIKTKNLRFPQKDKISLGHMYGKDYSFEIEIPLSTSKKYEIEFKSGNKTLNIDFSRPCNFSKAVGYAKTKHYLSTLKDNKITIKKKTTLNWIVQELKTLFNMVKNHEPGFEKAIPFRIAYMITYPFLRNKKIWFYMDRPEESDDNGLHLFKYAVNKDPDINKYFILSSKNKDFKEIEKIGKIIPYKSLKHRLLGLFAENIITSHPDNEVIYPFWGGYPFFAGLLKSNNIFLQHGILKDDISSWLNKSNMNLSFFLVSSKKEYDSTFKYPYNYDENVVQMLGLPRYDNLKNVEDRKQIIIMPSWRRNLTRKSNEYILETEYYKRFNSLINNKKLIKKARENNYEIIFRPHPKVYNFIDLFDKNDYVKIDYEKVKYQTLFNNGSLLITDYSSVAFDFAYLYKPVIYYQYGDDYHFNVENSFFDYETMGLGEICKDESELVDLIIEYIENDCKIKEKYSKRIQDFFIFTDKNNCKRVHEAIKEVPLKD